MSSVPHFPEKSLQKLKEEEEQREKVVEKELQSESLFLRVFSFVIAALVGSIVAIMTNQPWEIVIPFAVLCGLAPLFTAIFISAINKQVTIAKMRDGSSLKDTND
jgi:Na+/glutamate symporter